MRIFCLLCLIIMLNNTYAQSSFELDYAVNFNMRNEGGAIGGALNITSNEEFFIVAESDMIINALGQIRFRNIFQDQLIIDNAGVTLPDFFQEGPDIARFHRPLYVNPSGLLATKRSGTKIINASDFPLISDWNFHHISGYLEAQQSDLVNTARIETMVLLPDDVFIKNVHAIVEDSKSSSNIFIFFGYAPILSTDVLNDRVTLYNITTSGSTTGLQEVDGTFCNDFCHQVDNDSYYYYFRVLMNDNDGAASSNHYLRRLTIDYDYIDPSQLVALKGDQNSNKK